MARFETKPPSPGHSALKRPSLGLLCLVVCLLPAGCGRAWLRRGPCPETLVECRQLSQQGLTAIERGQWEQAETLLVQAVQTAPIDASAHRLLAQVRWQRGAREEALNDLEEALRLAPDDAQAHALMAQFQLAQGHLEAANRHADQALALPGADAQVWALHSDIARRRGDARTALADVHQALARDPQNAQLLQQAAQLYLEAGQPLRALANLQAIEDRYANDDQPRELLMLLGHTNTCLGRYPEATNYFLAAHRHGPPSADVLGRLAESHLLAGHLGEARQVLAQAMATDPNHAGNRALAQRLAQADARLGTRLR